MAISTVTIDTPPNTNVQMSDDHTLRPQTVCTWTGGTGPFDVEYKWATDSGFTQNVITVTNNSVTSPDSAVPTSDLGFSSPGPTWYFQVKVTDTNDAGSLTEPTSGGYIYTYFEPNLKRTYLYMVQQPVLGPQPNGLDVPGANADTATTPDDVSFPTGDIEVEIRCRLDSYARQDGNVQQLIGQWDETGNDRAWRFVILQDGKLRFDFSTNGTAVTSLTSSAALPAAYVPGYDGFLKVTRDTTSGDVKFYTSADGDTFAQLGTTQTGATGSWNNSTAVMSLGGKTSPNGDPASGRYMEVIVLDADTGGTQVANPMFSNPIEWPVGTTTNRDDGAGNTWTLNGNTEVKAYGDGDTKYIKRHIYNYMNVVEWAEQVGKYENSLYLLANLTTDQPCPFIYYINPNTQKQGNSIVITGSGFGALKTTYDGEVRLYEDDSYGASYSILTTTAWGDEEITATVPNGSSSGFIAVVHTTTPSCAGSNFKFLNVLQKEPDPDAGWWIEAWDIENTQPQVTGVPVIRASFTKVLNDVGNGKITLPASYDRLNEIIDPFDTGGHTRVTTLLKVYMNDLFQYAFFASRRSDPYEEKGASLVDISGPGMESVMDWAIVFPRDWPANPSMAPTWKYGSTDTVLSNANFEDIGTSILNNPSGEEGNTEAGTPIGWDKRGTPDSYTAIKDDINSLDGNYYIYIDPGPTHSGIQQSINVTPKKDYTIKAYAKEPTAAGMRITTAVTGDVADGAVILGTNNYEYNNEILAELDNDPRNGAGNGCPGGSSDGTWQAMEVKLTTGTNQESMKISVQADHHGGCGAPGNIPFWVDDVTMTGWGLGLDPWQPYSSANHATGSFQLDGSEFRSGSWSCKIDPTARYAGIEQKVSVVANEIYQFSIWGKSYSPAVDDTWKLECIDADGTTILGSFSQVPGNGIWEEWTFALAMPENQEEVFFRFVYGGLNNPPAIYVDAASMTPGYAASSPGTIAIDMLATAQARGTIDWVQYSSFTGFEGSTSNGLAWDSNTLAMDLAQGTSYLEFLNRLVGFGFEWEVVPIDFVTGGDKGYDLRLYNARGGEPFSVKGVGRNWREQEEEPVIVSGKGLSGGSFVRGASSSTVSLVEGADGAWSIEERTDAIPDYKRRETYTQNQQVTDYPTLNKLALTVINAEAGKDFGLKLNMVKHPDLTPLLHFKVGDSVKVNVPGEAPEEYYRIVSVTCNLEGEGSQVDFFVDVNRAVLEETSATLQAINRLLTGRPPDNISPGTGIVSGGGGGGSSTPTSTTIQSHTHDLSEISTSSVGGDLAGTLTNPLVDGLQGRTVSSDTPSDDDLMKWDDTLQAWVPKSLPIYDFYQTFSIANDIELETGVHRFIVGEACTIIGVQAALGTAPTGADAIFDVNKNGTTIFTTQGNRPTILDAANQTAAEAVPDVTALAAGDYLTVDVDQIGSTVAGADLTLTVRFEGGGLEE